MTETIIAITAMLSTVVVVLALLVTGFIFYRARQDIAEVEGIRKETAQLLSRADESIYISDEIVNVLYDLFDLMAMTKAYIEVVDGGLKIDDALFRQMNGRVAILEKHFAELGLFSQDEERRRTVQQSLANMYGDADTLRIMEKIASGAIGRKDPALRDAMRMIRGRLKAKMIYVESVEWTGRPSGGAF